MGVAQIALSLVLATMVFSVALELRVADFKRVAEVPRAVIAGLIPQFLPLPLATWGATLVLDLPANTEAAMILGQPRELPHKPEAGKRKRYDGTLECECARA